MRTVSLCLLVLVQSCTANEPPQAASVALGDAAELEECTEIVRGLLIHVEDLESGAAVRDVNCDAAKKILTRRAEAAEGRAARSEWLARWGAPLGAVGGAIVGAVVTAVMFVILGPQGR